MTNPELSKLRRAASNALVAVTLAGLPVAALADDPCSRGMTALLVSFQIQESQGAFARVSVGESSVMVPIAHASAWYSREARTSTICVSPIFAKVVWANPQLFEFRVDKAGQVTLDMRLTPRRMCAGQPAAPQVPEPPKLSGDDDEFAYGSAMVEHPDYTDLMRDRDATSEKSHGVEDDGCNEGDLVSPADPKR